MVEIRRVRTRKDRRNFINFENRLYSECEYFVPTIYKNEISLFNVKKNPNLISNESTGYLAYQEGKIVGRVLCFFNRVEKEEKNIIRFSHLDFINDTEVSFALFETIEKWANFLKADKIIGDISFNDLDNVGILDTGFDKISTFQNRYNYPYYSEHLKSYGFTTTQKLTEFQLRIKDDIETTNNHYDLHIVEGDKLFKIKNYGQKIFDLLYDNSISGFPTVVNEKVYERYFKNLNKLYNDEDLVIVTNDLDDVVGVMLLTNTTSIALQTTDGRVMASKNMYNIEENTCFDISLYLSTSENVDQLLINIIIDAMKKRNQSIVNTNLWINKNNKDLLDNFNIVWQRNRVIYGKKLNKLIVKKSSSDLAEKNLKSRTTILK